MKQLKRILLTMIASLPLGAVSYAAAFEGQVDQPSWTPEQIKTEFDARLMSNGLPSRYYDYLDRAGIVTMEELIADKNLEHYERLLKEFNVDKKMGVFRMAGAISIGTTM